MSAAKRLLAMIEDCDVPVLQRAQAIRSLKAVTPPEGWTSLILRMLNDDTQYCDRCPVRLEAAMVLARPFFEDGRLAMATLVERVMDHSLSEDWHVLAALQTWTHHLPTYRYHVVLGFVSVAPRREPRHGINRYEVASYCSCGPRALVLLGV